jgi:hypothetical protein
MFPLSFTSANHDLLASTWPITSLGRKGPPCSGVRPMSWDDRLGLGAVWYEFRSRPLQSSTKRMPVFRSHRLNRALAKRQDQGPCASNSSSCGPMGQFFRSRPVLTTTGRPRRRTSNPTVRSVPRPCGVFESRHENCRRITRAIGCRAVSYRPCDTTACGRSRDDRQHQAR